MLRRRAIAERLAGLDVELPLRTDHLPPRLGTLVRDARLTRRSLETPLGRALDTGRGPWGGGLSDYDLALTDARRTLWDWLRHLGRLEAADYVLLRQLRLDPRPLRGLMYQRGLFERGDRVFEGWLPAAPNVDVVTEGLCTAIEHLRRFEIALLSHRPDPYR